jgi:hypothetical protein
MQQWSSGISSVASSATSGLVGVGIAAATGLAAAGVAVVGFTKQFADYGSKIDDASQRTGMSATALSELGYAAKMSGLEFGQLEGAIKKMQVGIGSGKADDALAKLGLDPKQIAAMNPEEQFNSIASAIGSIADPAGQAAAAVSIFGKSGTDLLPLFKEGPEGMAALREEAKSLGVSLSTQDAKSAAAFGDAWDKVQTAFQGVTNAIGGALAPALTVVAEWIAKNVGAVANWIKKNSIFVTSSEVAWAGLKLAWVSFSNTLIGTWDLVTTSLSVGANEAWAGIQTGFELTFQALESTGYAIIEVVGGAFKDATTFALGYITAMEAAFPAIGEQLQGIKSMAKETSAQITGVIDTTKVASQMSLKAGQERLQKIEANRQGADAVLRGDLDSRRAERQAAFDQAVNNLADTMIKADRQASDAAKQAEEEARLAAKRETALASFDAEAAAMSDTLAKAASKGTAIAKTTAEGKTIESKAGTFTAAAARGLGAAGGFETQIASATQRTAKATEKIADAIDSGALGLAME